MAKLASTTAGEVPTGALPTAIANPFKPAATLQSRVRMLLTGATGCGKTYTALMIARALANGGKVAVIDTESGSAALYKDLYPFDVLNLTQYTPRFYVQAIKLAAQHGYSVCIIDSLTHAWNGKGGVLDIADGNIRGWKDATPEHRSLIDTIASMRNKMHVIGTLRSKMRHDIETGIDGRLTVRKMGLQPIQREDLPYEFDIIGDLDQTHTITFSKSRCSDLDGKQFVNPGSEVATIISSWLTGLGAVAIDPNLEGSESEEDES